MWNCPEAAARNPAPDLEASSEGEIWRQLLSWSGHGCQGGRAKEKRRAEGGQGKARYK